LSINYASFFTFWISDHAAGMQSASLSQLL